LFFFSSRRRHTRFSRDWSSDVCSSDLDVASLEALVDPALVAARDEFGRGALARAAEAASAPAVALLIRRGAPVEAPDQNGTTPRSEERRVGKECISRMWPGHSRVKVRA